MNGTPFVKENFRWDGMFLSYYDPATAEHSRRVTGFSAQFIARFKYNRRDRASFQKFLIANFSVEEYYNARISMAPAEILKSKGWVSPTVKRARELINSGDV